MTPLHERRTLLQTALRDITLCEDVCLQNAFTMLLAELRQLGDTLDLDVPQALNESYRVYLELRKDISSPPRDVIGEVLFQGRGFIILTHNASNEPDSRFEAWAYEGPLDFDHALPLRFGLGVNPIEALLALSDHLCRPDDSKSD